MTFENALGPYWNYKVRWSFVRRYPAYSIIAIYERIKRLFGCAYHQRMTRHKTKHPYHCESQLNQFFGDYVWIWLDTVCYLEHPKSKKLQPITKCLRHNTRSNWILVWLADFSLGPIRVHGNTLMYVSEEPHVAGKTLKQVKERHANNRCD